MSYDDKDYIDEEDIFTFPSENLFTVLDEMKTSGKLLSTCDTQELCDMYAKLFPMKDGVYKLSFDHMKTLHMTMCSNSMRKLVQEHLIEVLWDDKTNDFVFQITELGRQVNEDMKHQ